MYMNYILYKIINLKKILVNYKFWCDIFYQFQLVVIVYFWCCKSEVRFICIIRRKCKTTRCAGFANV